MRKEEIYTPGLKAVQVTQDCAALGLRAWQTLHTHSLPPLPRADACGWGPPPPAALPPSSAGSLLHAEHLPFFPLSSYVHSANVQKAHAQCLMGGAAAPRGPPHIAHSFTVHLLKKLHALHSQSAVRAASSSLAFFCCAAALSLSAASAAALSRLALSSSRCACARLRSCSALSASQAPVLRSFCCWLCSATCLHQATVLSSREVCGRAV